MLKTLSAAVLGLAVFAGAASATSIGFTEGARPLVAGTTPVGGDAPNGAPGFDLTASLMGGVAQAGDTVDLFGRIVTAKDAYQFESAADFTVSFIDDAFRLEGAGSNTSVFRLIDNATMMEVAASTFVDAAGTGLIFGASAGDYTFIVDGATVPGNAAALYDVQFATAPIPLPAAAPLLVAALGGLAMMRRRR